jgi:molybdopterin adenylyltransferase
MRRLRIGIVTVSDRASRGIYEDRSGPAIQSVLEARLPYRMEFHYRLVPDERELIQQAILELTATCGLVVTTGGTGPAPRDVTPEATLPLLEKVMPGLPEVIRQVSLAETPTAILYRGVAGIRGTSLILNLPGNPRAISTCLEAVLPALPDLLGLISALLG